MIFETLSNCSEKKQVGRREVGREERRKGGRKKKRKKGRKRRKKEKIGNREKGKKKITRKNIVQVLWDMVLTISLLGVS